MGSPLCTCGLVGDADHYVYRRPLTDEFHLKEPSDEHRKSWFKNLRYNGQAQSKLIQAYKIKCSMSREHLCGTGSMSREHLSGTGSMSRDVISTKPG
ncbi:hypothetical protein AVEN_151976-1 [Araneus ventricosus]|uniref:Uncharacterized protein n=1 Tax=Araneus ventricosus TaxID=182803 RepID=A0A4Y2UVS6_ARAVE|nr:hypothetical protein AVEN_151976-1 [Araneus ventricosus]